MDTGVSNGPVAEWKKIGNTPNTVQYFFLKHIVHILASTLPLLSCYNLQFSSVQSLSHVRLFATP